MTKTANRSTLARVVQMVTKVQTDRWPTQRFTDRFQRIFVPAVLARVVLLLFAWVVVDETFAERPPSSRQHRHAPDFAQNALRELPGRRSKRVFERTIL